MSRLLPALVVVGVLVLVAAPIVVAQELTTAADYRELVKPFWGYWKSTVESDGKVIESTYRARYSPTNTCALTYAEGGSLPAVQSLDGYDPVAKKWTVAAFDAEGNFRLARMTFQGVKKGQPFSQGIVANIESAVYSPDGTTTTGTAKAECLECTENRIVSLGTERTENGKSLPDTKRTMERLSEMKRPTRSPAPPVTADEITVADYIEFWRPLAGSWKTSTETDGKAIEGTWRARLSATNTCFVTYGEGGGFPAAQTIDGYDPVAKKWTVVGFDADGGFSIGTTEFTEMKKGKRLGPGVIGIGEEKLFKADGTTTTITSKLSCLECTENRVVLVWSERKENGQPKPDLKWICERQPERARKVRQ